MFTAPAKATERRQAINRLIVILLLALAMTACGTSKGGVNGDVIVVRAYRKDLLHPFGSYLNYAVSTDGSEVPFSFPPNVEDEFEWSPDGQWIVFSSLHREGARAGGNSELYLVRSNGDNPMRITDYPYDDTSPTWSPDGNGIAYSTSTQVRIMNLGCLLRTELCNPRPTLLVEGDLPSWSPDGNRIVYKSYVRKGIFTTGVADNRQPLNLIPNLGKGCSGPASGPQWSPHADKIAFDCENGIYTVNPDGSDLTRVTESKDMWLEFMPKWTPDARGIVHASRSKELGLGKCIEGSCGSSGIYSSALFIMKADGSNKTRLTKSDDESIIWYTWLPPRLVKELSEK